MTTYAEEAAYLANAAPTLRDVVRLMLESGLRPEEVFTLQGGAADLDHGYLRVLRGKTSSARRRIELTETAKGILAPRGAAKPAGFLIQAQHRHSGACLLYAESAARSAAAHVRSALR